MMSSLEGLKNLIKSKRVRQESPKDTPNAERSIEDSDLPRTHPTQAGIPSMISPKHRKLVSTSGSIRDSNTIEEATSQQVGTTMEHLRQDEELPITFLRNLGHPVRIFGETDEERSKRISDLREAEDLRLPQPGKVRDRQSAPFETFPAWLNEMPSGDDVLLSWIHDVFKQWSSLLNPLSSMVESKPSKDEIETLFRRTAGALEPLLVAYKSGLLDDTLCSELLNIATSAKKRRYRDANHAYLQLSIGKKAWPIGVGHVFIQERASMDKIATSSHIMNNETVRGYIQSVKRLLTKSAEFWPPSDPGQFWNS